MTTQKASKLTANSPKANIDPSRLPTVEISETRPLVSILRACFSLQGEQKLSNKSWLKNHQVQIRAAGHVLAFLGLAELDEKSRIGWRPNQDFFLTVKRARSALLSVNRRMIVECDPVMDDMLWGIASHELWLYKNVTCSHWQMQHMVMSFISHFLVQCGLLRDVGDDFVPTRALGALLVRGTARAVKRACPST